MANLRRVNLWFGNMQILLGLGLELGSNLDNNQSRLNVADIAEEHKLFKEK